MRIILSRKGFDSSAGGKPSPILPDGRMLSLPIPSKQSPIRYKDIRWQEYNLGMLVSDLTGGRIPASHFAHLDPDISSESLSRHSEWRPIFGQTGAAQGHLRKNNVQTGDIFLFFGLFRNVIETAGKLIWDKRSPLRHVLWGWLQIDEVLKVDGCNRSKYEWAKYHPHFHQNFTNNTLYIARKYLTLRGVSSRGLAGAGIFPYFSEQLVLTTPAATTPSQWELPQWFYPRDGKCPLTYHSDLARWQRTENGTRLNAVARGQEFILDTEEFHHAIEWTKMLFEGT
jgi:hypothetical protein